MPLFETGTPTVVGVKSTQKKLSFGHCAEVSMLKIKLEVKKTEYTKPLTKDIRSMALARLIRFVIYAVRASLRLKDAERYNISLLISILFSTSHLAFRIFAETKLFNYDLRRSTSAG